VGERGGSLQGLDARARTSGRPRQGSPALDPARHTVAIAVRRATHEVPWPRLTPGWQLARDAPRCCFRPSGPSAPAPAGCARPCVPPLRPDKTFLGSHGLPDAPRGHLTLLLARLRRGAADLSWVVRKSFDREGGDSAITQGRISFKSRAASSAHHVHQRGGPRRCPTTPSRPCAHRVANADVDPPQNVAVSALACVGVHTGTVAGMSTANAAGPSCAVAIGGASGTFVIRNTLIGRSWVGTGLGCWAWVLAIGGDVGAAIVILCARGVAMAGPPRDDATARGARCRRSVRMRRTRGTRLGEGDLTLCRTS
jgi:hypothetical protein